MLVVSPGPIATAIGTRRLSPDGSAGQPGPARSGPADMPVEECVRQIMGSIDRRDRELVMTAQGRLLMLVKPFLPKLVDRMVARAIEKYQSASS